MNLFSYQDYRQYLRDFYAEEKKRNPKFSFRYFARIAGLPSFNYLKLIMDGKRNLTPFYIKKFVKGLKLNGFGTTYFETLIQMNQSRDPLIQKECFKKLIRIIRGANGLEVPRDKEEIYDKWYHWAIREMTLLPDFKEDPEWISKQLKGSITPTQAKKSLSLLKKLRLVGKEKGKLISINRIVRSSDEVENLLIKKLHESFIQKALQALYNIPLNEREFAGLTIALSKEKVSFIKEKIKEWRRELNEILSAEEKLEEVYQLNIQFYPLTGGNE